MTAQASDPSTPAASAEPTDDAAEAARRTEIKRRNALARKTTRFIRRLREIEPGVTDDDARARFAVQCEQHEAYIAERLARHPDWDRSRAASGFDLLIPRATVTEDSGWTVLKPTWPFQRRLWRRHGVVLAFGEYSRLINRAWIPAETPEQNKANYTRRTAEVALDNGMPIQIVLLGSIIFGFADEVAGLPGLYIKRKHMRLGQSLLDKYGVALDAAVLQSIKQQITEAQDRPVLAFSHERGIHRVQLADQREVYIFAHNGRPIEAKKAAGVRKGIAAHIRDLRKQRAKTVSPAGITGFAEQPVPATDRNGVAEEA